MPAPVNSQRSEKLAEDSKSGQNQYDQRPENGIAENSAFTKTSGLPGMILAPCRHSKLRSFCLVVSFVVARRLEPSMRSGRPDVVAHRVIRNSRFARVILIQADKIRAGVAIRQRDAHRIGESMQREGLRIAWSVVSEAAISRAPPTSRSCSGCPWSR